MDSLSVEAAGELAADDASAVRAALGRLTDIPTREVWIREDRDFTPWLLANADVLAEALGLDLELSSAEHAVGGFSLDLVGRDITNDAVLIVENQLERTNHSHLGQLLTYSAGTGAQTIVWVATGFSEEHRQALDWLNEQTAEDVRFFGVAVRVVTIDGSARAPLLEVVAKPNDWQKHVRATTRGRLQGKAAYYVEFWSKFLEAVRVRHPEWTRATRANEANWFSMTSGVGGAGISMSFAAGGRLRHELYIDLGDPEENLAMFERFRAKHTELEASYGRTLEFEDLPGRRACRIADYTDGDVTELDRHDEFIDWFIDAGERLRRALSAVST